MQYEFKTKGELFEWRGPAPFYFVKVDPKTSALIKQRSRALSYGWGVLHVNGEISGIKFETALIPKDETYYFPIKNAVRQPFDLQLDDEVRIEFNLGKGIA
ncbi:MAG: DUF1905 domain-containing protein [Actinobacteria bacterium]|nr:DUF1905 domain-containing protein [Actinomycetota bacterium]